jgi:hypothetical protein
MAKQHTQHTHPAASSMSESTVRQLTHSCWFREEPSSASEALRGVNALQTHRNARQVRLLKVSLCGQRQVNEQQHRTLAGCWLTGLLAGRRVFLYASTRAAAENGNAFKTDCQPLAGPTLSQHTPARCPPRAFLSPTQLAPTHRNEVSNCRAVARNHFWDTSC